MTHLRLLVHGNYICPEHNPYAQVSILHVELTGYQLAGGDDSSESPKSRAPLRQLESFHALQALAPAHEVAQVGAPATSCGQRACGVVLTTTCAALLCPAGRRTEDIRNTRSELGTLGLNCHLCSVGARAVYRA